MLKDTFFTINDHLQTGDEQVYRISLNANHPIYQGHFPGNPTTPGVCAVQLVKELASEFCGKTFFICVIKNVKFLRVLNPLENKEVSVHLSAKMDDSEFWVVTASIRNEQTVFSKVTLKMEEVGVKRKPLLQNRMEKLKTCVVIPTYNNETTLAMVVSETLCFTSSIIVVNDGSTDSTGEILKRFDGQIEVISYEKNRGKGYALKQGFDRAEALGYRSAITMDSDGQHDARDLKTFIYLSEIFRNSLLVGRRTNRGRMPSKNSFANKFSNFWFTVQTGHSLRDTQNGFRSYPLAAMKKMRPYCSRYEAETELLIRCTWRGIRNCPVPVHVYYAPEGKRVTHFRPGKDFFRISLLNTVLTILAILYGYPAMLYHKLFSKIEW
ncbi:MAG: glycosyltransferase [Tannerella sp.]|jgi:3-hydroxymyristoyl/3-hydroxydecanoyl-(acyl carrier protein) dehydratase|nr:glycosyltransferase [Tannerella sp.]